MDVCVSMAAKLVTNKVSISALFSGITQSLINVMYCWTWLTWSQASKLNKSCISSDVLLIVGQTCEGTVDELIG